MPLWLVHSLMSTFPARKRAILTTITDEAQCGCKKWACMVHGDGVVRGAGSAHCFSRLKSPGTAAKAVDWPLSMKASEHQNANKCKSMVHSWAIVLPEAIIDVMLENLNEFHIIWLSSRTTLLPIPPLLYCSFHVPSSWGSDCAVKCTNMECGTGISPIIVSQSDII